MDRDTISFATFNLHNLQAAGLPIYDEGAPSEEEVAKRVEWIAAMLRRAQADVVGVQELWHPGPLRDALARAGLDDTHEVLFDDIEEGSRPTCGAVVRSDLLDGEPTWEAAFPEAMHLEDEGRGAPAPEEDPGAPRAAAGARAPQVSVAIDRHSRPVLNLRLRPREGERAVEVFVCHLKSRRPTPVDKDDWFLEDPDLYRPHREALGAALSTIRRTAEAAALRVRLTQVMARNRTPVVVLGDLNDGPDTATLALLTEQPPFAMPARPGNLGTALYSVQQMQEARSLRDVYYTYIFRGVHGSLDHVLASAEFFDGSNSRVWSLDGLDIFNDHLNRPGIEIAQGGTDHGIVRARFRYDPFASSAADTDPVPLDGAATGP